LKRSFCFLLALAATPVALSSASDLNGAEAIFGGAAADLVPLESTRVTLREQDVLMSAEGDKLSVRARYVFFNPSAADATLKLAFPEYRCAVDQECTDTPFFGVTTSAEDRQVKLEEAPLDDRYPFADYSGVAWQFELTFPAQKTLTVVHRYSLSASREINGTFFVSYITRSGESFSGSVERARLSLRMPVYTHTVFKALEGGLSSTGPKTVFGDAPRVEINYEASNWRPEGGIDLSFNASVHLAEARIAQTSKQFADLFATTPCAYPDIKATDAEHCRNLYHAAKGFPFKEPELRERYYRGSPEFRLVESAPAGQLWLRDLRPFEGFSEEWFSVTEKQQLKRFDKVQRAAEKKKAAERAAASTAPQAASCACRASTRRHAGPGPLGALALILFALFRRRTEAESSVV
jgi:MYXO-CTERM domain-containing protein